MQSSKDGDTTTTAGPMAWQRPALLENRNCSLAFTVIFALTLIPSGWWKQTPHQLVWATPWRSTLLAELSRDSPIAKNFAHLGALRIMSAMLFQLQG